MSKHETWRTRKYWESVGGLLIEEFMLVAKSRDGRQVQRLLAGLIVAHPAEENFSEDGLAPSSRRGGPATPRGTHMVGFVPTKITDPMSLHQERRTGGEVEFTGFYWFIIIN